MSARDVIALQEFAKWAIREGAFQAADLDGLSIQEKAHELGLIEATTYDPAEHGPSDIAYAGDEWFVFAPSLTAAGYTIIRDDEIHAPSVERAIAVAVETYGSAKDWDYFGSAHVAIAAALRELTKEVGRG